MDQNFRKRLQKTLYCGELEAQHCPLALSELAVEYFHDIAPHRLGHVDLESASSVVCLDSVSPSSMVVSMVYAERLQRKRPDYVRQMSSSDLFLISMMMASKYLYDSGVEEEVLNEEWAEKVDMDNEEINSMERDFLDAIEWEMHVKKEDFNKTMSAIEKCIAMREGLKRNWFSYTDFCLLMDDAWQLSVKDVGLEWLQVVFVSSAAYFAGIMTMVGSTVLVTSASAALLSSGLLPVLSGLHTTDVALLLQPSYSPLCPLPMMAHSQISYPICTGLHTNDTKEDKQEERSEESQSEHQEQPQHWTAGKTVLDTILSQLMAVLTIKSHLMRFVYAVSDNYVSSMDRNHSLKTDLHQTPNTWVEPMVEIGLFHGDSRLSHGFEFDLSAEINHSAGGCAFCGKKKTTDSGAALPALDSRDCHVVWCRQCQITQHGLYDKERLEDQCDNDVCRCLWKHGPFFGKQCKEMTTTSMHSVFPDIQVGFSTSMPPPVYAT